MIDSILDTDLYKFSTSYAYMKLFPEALGTFEFIDRSNREWSPKLVTLLNLEIQNLRGLQLQTLEKIWCIRHISYIPQMYWEWLSSYQFDPSELTISLGDDGKLIVKASGLLYRITLWEVPILAIISELSYKVEESIPDSEWTNRLESKINLANFHNLPFSEFGTRRRFSSKVQEEVLNIIKSKSHSCTGTSNVHLAKLYGLKPMGTHPHEWFMFHGAMYGYRNANYMALENWVNVYDGNLGIALPDTYTSPVFFSNFSRKHAKLFDGTRQDSGDPYLYVNLAVNRYKMLGISPQSKTIIFSDNLTMEKCVDIKEYCGIRINSAFGIGTNLTNDVGHKPCNMVMKLISCQMNENQPEIPCIKLSDSKGKNMGDELELEICKKSLGLWEA